MRCTFRLAMSLVGAAIVGISGAVACSSFQAAVDESTEDAGRSASLVDAGSGPGDDEVDAGVAYDCIELAPRTMESFNVGVNGMQPARAGSGMVTTGSGVMLATVAAKTGERAYYGRTVAVPTADTFGHARLRFTFKDLVPPPAGVFVEGGCVIELAKNDTNRSAVRLELRPGSMRLDDVQLVDGGPTDSGIGTELTVFTTAARDYVVTIDVVQDGNGLSSTASVLGETAVTKRTPLDGPVDKIDLHCGINATSASNADAGTRYTVRIDDVAIDLCKMAR